MKTKQTKWGSTAACSFPPSILSPCLDITCGRPGAEEDPE